MRELEVRAVTENIKEIKYMQAQNFAPAYIAFILKRNY